MEFRKLNNKTIKDAYAIPRVEDILHLLARAKFFSKLDLRSGYWQVEIEEKDKHKTAFQVGRWASSNLARCLLDYATLQRSFKG